VVEAEGRNCDWTLPGRRPCSAPEKAAGAFSPRGRGKLPDRFPSLFWGSRPIRKCPSCRGIRYWSGTVTPIPLIADGGRNGGNPDLAVAVLERDIPVRGFANRGLLLAVLVGYFGSNVLHTWTPFPPRERSCKP
jgi:hypothetical protein